MSREEAAAGLVRFLEETCDAPEVLWCAGLALLERGVVDARERSAHFRHRPSSDLRRLRREVAQGLRLCRLAAHLQVADDEREGELHEELRRLAEEAGRQARRAQTLPAERARLAKHAARKAAAGAG